MSPGNPPPSLWALLLLLSDKSFTSCPRPGCLWMEGEASSCILGTKSYVMGVFLMGDNSVTQILRTCAFHIAVNLLQIQLDYIFVQPLNWNVLPLR